MLEHVEVIDGLPAHVYRNALSAVETANETRASSMQFAKALAVLTAVCAKPGDFDDAKVVLWSERLKQVLGEYPGDVALAAVSEWPKAPGGKWLPTENEIRGECERLMRFRAWIANELYRAAEAAHDPEAPDLEDGLSGDPSGAVADLVERMSRADAERTRIYLRGARFGEAMIGVSTRQAQFELQKLAARAGSANVRIMRPEEVRADGLVTEWVE